MGNSILDTLIQTGGTIAVLAFFLRYFMAEQKELRQKMEAAIAKYEAEMKEQRRVYDDKLDTVVKQMAELNNRTITALNDVKTSNDKITEAVNSLTDKLDAR